MAFRNPWGWLALLLILPLILLYILKKQHEDMNISSTLLWQQVFRDLQATRPWQRLRTQLLLILQVLALILFALSLARPISFSGQGGISYIAIVDTSARMQAVDVRPSRMEAARTALLDLIRRMKTGDVLTIVLADQQPFVLAGPSDDKALLAGYVNEIQPSNGKTDLGSAVQLAQTLLQDQGRDGGQIHVFSDKALSGADSHEELFFHVFAGNGENAAVTHVGYNVSDRNITALSRVANYGTGRNVTLELKVDGSLHNVKEVSLPADEEISVYWPDIPASAREVVVSISEEDDLLLDNTGMAAISDEHKVKVLLTTERNVFLERAVSLRGDIELLKANPGEAPESSDFHLYIYDGGLPALLPETGHIIAFSPAAHEDIGLIAEGEIQPSGVIINPQIQYPSLMQYVEPEGYQIANAVRVNVPEGFTVLLQDRAGSPLLIAGERDGRRMALFSFSLHDSNLPLKADFPILIQNLLNWLVPPGMTFTGQVFAGDPLPLSPFPDATGIIVRSPGGREYSFDAYPPPVFHDTREIGFYEVVQEAGERTYSGGFAVLVPTDEVSDLRTDSQPLEEEGDRVMQTAASPFQREIWMLAGWALLLLLLTEWWVYHHGI